jgi:uncharacterized protein (DUF2336 family)
MIETLLQQAGVARSGFVLPRISQDSSDPLERQRVRLASDPMADAAVLASMSKDPSVTVRTALAINPAAGGTILTDIAGDPDERVRAVLAHRLALLLPTLPVGQLAPLQAQALSTLSLMVADEAVRVRLAIASVIRELPNVPHALVLQLARDAAVVVSDPIIRLSPLLDTDDLLSLVTEPTGPATLVSVARRPHLATRVANQIAAGANTAAIAALLENQSSGISEAALDQVIARAAEHPSWHAGLVRRPHLSAAASRALAEFVVRDALADLATRTDLPPGLAQTVASRLMPILAANMSEAPISRPKPPSLDQALVVAQAMARAGQITEDATIEAARRGEVRMCIAMLAVAACLDIAVVERASTLRSAKGLVSLIWRAGLTMRCSGMLQTLLLRLPPEAILRPKAGGGFPLTPEEMIWQVDFLIRIGSPPTQRPQNGMPDDIGRIGTSDSSGRPHNPD